MVAKLAKDDFEDLKAAGLDPTLEDFDRLNQLAIRLEDGPETTPANHPRIGWAGDVPFYEPTAAAIMWLQDYADRVKCDRETHESFFFFACAHALDPVAFRGLDTPRAIGRAVREWLRVLKPSGRLIAINEREETGIRSHSFDDPATYIGAEFTERDFTFANASREAILEAFRRAGLRNVRLEHMKGCHMVKSDRENWFAFVGTKE